MDDVLLLQTIERYLDGRMDAEEKAFFEQHRKNVPEIDQMVVEHAMFLHQMEDYAANHSLKHSLHLAHEKLLANGDINEGGELTTKAKVVKMWTKYRKVTAIAAVVGGAIAFMISGLVAYFAPTNNLQALQQLSQDVQKLKEGQQYQGKKLNEVVSKIPKGSVVTGGGTGFIIDTKGYVVTNAHVVKGSSFAILYNNKGDQYKAKIVFRDEEKDLAILKIDDSDFATFKSLPYSIKKANGNLGEEIFTMGYPKNDVVVGVGYLSSRTGLNGDTLSCQLQMNANPGNSGSPVLNKNGEIIGVLNGRQAQADGVGFAIKSKNIYQVVEDFKKTDSSSQKIKLPSTNAALKGMDRPDQIAAMEACVFFVKAYNK
jgi:S1-C subfamily serine protease